jgi:hypothetical protein
LLDPIRVFQNSKPRITYGAKQTASAFITSVARITAARMVVVNVEGLSITFWIKRAADSAFTPL